MTLSDAPVSPDLPADVAIPRLVEREGGRLHAIGRRMCGNDADADDLVQEVFLRAYRKWHQFEGRSSPATWLYAIAARAAGSMRRGREGRERGRISLESLVPFGDATVAAIDDEHDPLDEELRAEALERVETALAALPAPFRVPLVLKDIADLPVAEVASILGLKPATVKTRVHRARLRIRAALETALPRRPAAPSLYSRRVCFDLLEAEQDAIDRGVPFDHEIVCERCRSVFATLRLGRELCADLGDTTLPAILRRRILAEVERASSADSGDR